MRVTLGITLYWERRRMGRTYRTPVIVEALQAGRVVVRPATGPAIILTPHRLKGGA